MGCSAWAESPGRWRLRRDRSFEWDEGDVASLRFRSIRRGGLHSVGSPDRLDRAGRQLSIQVRARKGLRRECIRFGRLG